MSIKPSAAADFSHLLSWSACIPTLNRFDVLQISIRCLLAQTRLPKQIIIIDASQDFEKHRCHLEPMFSGTGVEFILQPAVEKSSAVQRNQGLLSVTADIVLFMDDDSLLFPDCAEKFMSAFEKDQEQAIAGLAIRNVDELPPAAKRLLSAEINSEKPVLVIKQKKNGATENKKVLRNLARFSIWRFFRREILMQSMNRMFVPYDYRRHRLSDHVEVDGLVSVRHFPGYGMTVRAHIARAEQFNPFLLAYCPCEDLDASYRYGRYGLCAYAPNAFLKHYEVESSRITRMQATCLGISNVALFVHSNSDSPWRHRALFALFFVRRLIGETLKDMLARRLDFPQARGVVAAIPHVYGIFKRPLSDAQNWYLEKQREFLKFKNK